MRQFLSSLVILALLTACSKSTPVTVTAPPVNIAIVNNSTVATDSDIQTTVAAIQIQVSRDLASVWTIPTETLTFYPTGSVIPSGSWLVYIADNTDMVGAFGYHNVTNGLPTGYAFAITSGPLWQEVLSHEILEMSLDPYLTTYLPAGSKVLEEICDPVNGSTYQINNVPVSDFVTPEWYNLTGTAPFDFLHLLSAPLTYYY